jgi:methionyl-tRNA formyltransferase
MSVTVAFLGTDVAALKALLHDKRLAVTWAAKIEGLDVLELFHPLASLISLSYKQCIKGRYVLAQVLLLIAKVFKFSLPTHYQYYIRIVDVVAKNKVKVVDLEEQDLINELSRLDTAVVSCWGILSEAVLKAPKKGMINIHPSPLPAYRGAVPTLAMLKDGASEGAVAFMVLEEKMDAGPLLKVSPFSIASKDNWFDVESKIASIIKSDLSEIVHGYVLGEIIPVVQNDGLATYTATYGAYRLIDISTEKISDIQNKVYLYPRIDIDTYCFFKIDKTKIFVKGCKLRLQAMRKPASCGLLGIRIRAVDGTLYLRYGFDISLKDAWLLSKQLNR